MKSKSFNVGEDFALSALDAFRLYVEPCRQKKKVTVWLGVSYITFASIYSTKFICTLLQCTQGCVILQGVPRKVLLKISSLVVKHALSYLWEFIKTSKTNRQWTFFIMTSNAENVMLDEI